MSIRSYKWSIAVLLCIVGLFGWRCWVLFGQVVAADFIDKECKITEELCTDFPLTTPRDVSFLAMNLEFLMGYYESRSNTFVGSHLEQTVRRDYEHAITTALATLRRETTNDLGDNPRTWIQKYGR